MPRKGKAREHVKGNASVEHARRLYLAHPLLPASDIARLLGVSRQTVHEYCLDLKDQRDRLRVEALATLKRTEGL
jgi:hypothetical protein